MYKRKAQIFGGVHDGKFDPNAANIHGGINLAGLDPATAAKLSEAAQNYGTLKGDPQARAILDADIAKAEKGGETYSGELASKDHVIGVTLNLTGQGSKGKDKVIFGGVYNHFKKRGYYDY